jgi:hypothetical protein
MKKLHLFLLIGLVLALAACGGNAEPTTDQEAAGAPTNTTEPVQIPARPVIHLTAQDRTYNGLQGAYCWLQAANDIRCEPDPLNMAPADSVPVESGETLTFTVDGETGSPAAFYATLLDDKNTEGNPIVVDFGSSTSADYVVALEPGTHRLSVVAEYPEVGGDNTFVTTIFAVTVPEAVVEVPTETPTQVPEATEAPTEEPVIEPTKAPIVAATATLAPTVTPPPPVLPTTAPQGTLPTALPTAAPPTALPVEAGGEAAPPAVVVINGGQTFLPAGTEYCYSAAGVGETCAETPVSPESEYILVNNGDTLRIDAADGGPETMIISLHSNDLTTEFQRVTIPGNAVSLHTISGTPGNYVLQIEAVWPGGEATYYFRLQIVG